MPAVMSYASWGTDPTRLSSRHSIAVTRTRGSASHLPPGVSTFRDARGRRLRSTSAEIVVVAITSNAIRPVIGRIADALGQPRAIVVVGKGFDSGPNGDEILLLPHVMGEFTPAPVVGVGGPSIAKEVALGTPTAAIFGSGDPGALAFHDRCSARPPTPSRPPTTSPDSRWRRR